MTAMIVGCGNIAGGYSAAGKSPAVLTHAAAYTDHPDFDLVACIEPADELRAQFMKTWKIPQGFANLQSAFDAIKSVDVVSVCAPTPTHVEILGDLLNRPVKLVFAEKPLGGQVAGAEHLVAAYKRKGTPLAVAYLRRWDQEMDSLRAEIAQGEWGAFRSAAGFYGRGILNNGSHLIDLFSFLVSSAVTVRGAGPLNWDGVSDDPTVDAVLEVDGAHPFHLIGADGRDYALFELTLVFEKGVVSLEEGGLVIRRRPAQPCEVFGSVERPCAGTRKPTGLPHAFLNALDNIEAAIERGEMLKSNGESALKAIGLADEIRRMAMAKGTI